MLQSKISSIHIKAFFESKRLYLYEKTNIYIVLLSVFKYFVETTNESCIVF